MSNRYRRRELLVSGWIRLKGIDNFPPELIQIVELLCLDVIHWSFTGIEYKRLKFMIAGIGFFLKTYTSFESFKSRIISLFIEKSLLPQTVMHLTIAVKVEGNLFDTTKHVLEYDIVKKKTFGQRLCECNYNEIHNGKYAKFDMKFTIDVLNITYYRIKVTDKLRWKLNKHDLRILRKKTGNKPIVTEMNNWLFFIDADKNLYMRPVYGLLHDIVLLKIEYDLVIKNCDIEIIVKKNGVIHILDTYREYIYKLNHSQLGNVRIPKLEIIIDYKITDIRGRNDGYKSLCHDLWSSYGFV